MGDAERKLATYTDVLAASEHLIAQVIDGELHTQPRPAGAHATFSSELGIELGPRYAQSPA